MLELLGLAWSIDDDVILRDGLCWDNFMIKHFKCHPILCICWLVTLMSGLLIKGYKCPKIDRIGGHNQNQKVTIAVGGW